MNTVWQPTYLQATYDDIPSRTVVNRYLGTLTPGVETDNVVDGFDDQHTLQRIRGSSYHNLEGSSTPYICHVNMAMFIVPAAVSANLADADMPNLFQSGDGEDFPLFQTHICGPQTSTNLDTDVDFRAKRKLDPGDKLVFCATYFNNSSVTTLDLHIALNLRLLWSLRK